MSEDILICVFIYITITNIKFRKEIVQQDICTAMICNGNIQN